MHTKSYSWVAPALWMLASLGLLSGVARLIITGNALVTGVAPADPGDIHYINHPWLTLLHVLPGMIFLLLGPLQFMKGLRQRKPQLHRLLGRVALVSGLLAGTTALAMNLLFPPVGGLAKNIAMYVFSGGLIGSLLLAFKCMKMRDIASHRAWMIRAYAIGLAISTMRFFFIPWFFVYGMPSELVIGLGVWGGFVINLLVAEWILRRDQVRLPAVESV
jgi:uncharacterized membrane protein